jgi:thioesterase domain-containing protein
MQKMQSAASNKYKPEKYAGPVLLIRAEDSQSEKIPIPSLAWDKVAVDLTIQWVPGTHTSMMKLPNINRTSEVINKWTNTRNIFG